MSIYSKDSRLYEPIMKDPSIIPVINRFGISLGVGDMNIRNICGTHGIDIDFFLAVVNTYLNPDYFPDRIFDVSRLPALIEFLMKTDSYYTDVQLPNIERHFNLLLSRGGGAESPQSNLRLLKGFFSEVKEELQVSVDDDCRHWFPMLLEEKGRQAARAEIEAALRGEEEGGAPVRLPFGNSSLEDKIRDLLSFFVIHLRGEYDRNLCTAVIMAISNLEKDIKQNNRIRERILRPICLR